MFPWGRSYEGGPPPGTAHIYCSVGVLNNDDGGLGLVVDPNDFSISGSDAETIPPDAGLTKALEPNSLDRTEIFGELETATGILAFSLPDTISRPFAIMWWPGRPTHKDPVAVIIDRTISWENVADLLTVI
jgi:hypothetical protein